MKMKFQNTSSKDMEKDSLSLCLCACMRLRFTKYYKLVVKLNQSPIILGNSFERKWQANKVQLKS